MKMMGLTDLPYWASWFLTYAIVVTVISILCVAVASYQVLIYSDRSLVFVFFWLFGMSLFGFALFLSAFFSRERTAAVTGTLVYFGTSFVNLAVGAPQNSANTKNLGSLLTTVAVSLGSNTLA